MNKETLRMQMLSGVITESEYKAKLEEGAFDNPFAPKAPESQKGGGLQLKNAAMKVYSYIKKNGFTPYLTVDGKNVGDRMNHDFSIQVLTKSGHQGEGTLVIQGNQNKTNPQVVEKLQNDIIHDFPFLKKSNQSNPSQLLIKLEVDPKANVSESLNEHYIAGGIVGVGAINNPFEGRKKESYEDAFEYFLNKKYSLNEAEGDVMVDSITLVVYINKLISLADDMEYTPDMIQGLQDLKAGLSKGEMSVEDALDVIQQTIDITRDEIGKVEALGQAVGYNKAIVAKAREIASLGEGKEVEKPEDMTKHRIGVLSTLIADAEKDLAKSKENPELAKEIEKSIKILTSSLEALKAL